MSGHSLAELTSYRAPPPEPFKSRIQDEKGVAPSAPFETSIIKSR